MDLLALFCEMVLFTIGKASAVATLGAVENSQIVQRNRNIGMIGTECFLAYCQRALVQRLRIRIATLSSYRVRQIVQRSCNIGMIGTERFLVYRQRALVQRLGIRITPLVVVETRKIVARMPEPELKSALDRLIEAGLLFRQGIAPHATYLFKHALVQDAAYGTLLREPRRGLHAV